MLLLPELPLTLLPNMVQPAGKDDQILVFPVYKFVLGDVTVTPGDHHAKILTLVMTLPRRF